MSELEHFDSEIYAIEQRIGRLAIACGIDLAISQNVTALLKGDLAVCPHGDETLRHLLRQLLVLKYRVETSCAHELGRTQCQGIIDDVDEKLRRHGFQV